MSSLGEYVHYHWGRYLKYGITRKEDQDNFNPTVIFTSHRREVLNDIAKMKTFTNIKQLQNDYNEKNQKAYDVLVAAIKDPLRSQKTLKALLQLVNKSWNEQDIQKIIAGIQLDEAQQTLKFKPPQGSGFSSQKGFGIKKLPEKQRHYVSTYIKKFNEINSKITELGLSDDYRTNLNHIYSSITLAIQAFEAQRKFDANIKGNLIYNPALNGQINSLITELQGVNSINQILQQQLAEILGSLAVNGITEVIETELKNMMGSLTGQSLTSGSGLSISISSNLSQTWLQGEYESNESPYKSHIVKIQDDNTTGTIQYGFKSVADKVQQKADIVWEGNANISMKNTSLDNFQKTEDYIPAINLQSSALRVYIEGIEASKSGLGTHYINALASHPASKDDKTKLTETGNIARETLLLYMLYSALTGQGQNRIGATADILAIYDKKKNQGAQQVKLFSMKDILQKIAPTIAQQDGIISSPSLRSFRLENRFLGEGPSEIGATMRITKLLAELSIKNISMRLPKEKLREFIT